MENNRNIKLFTLEYPPMHGGVGHYFYHLVKFWPGSNGTSSSFVIPAQAGNQTKQNKKVAADVDPGSRPGMTEGKDDALSSDDLTPTLSLKEGEGDNDPPLEGGAACPEPGRRGGDGGISVITNDHQELVDTKRPFLKWWPAVKTMRSAVSDGDTVLIGQILPLGTAAFIASHYRKFDYYIILHGMDLGVALRQWRKRWLVRLIISRARGVIAANHHTAERLNEFMDREIDMIVVNPGIDPGILTNYDSEPTPTPPERGLNEDHLTPALSLNEGEGVDDSPLVGGAGGDGVTRYTLHVPPHSGDFIILSLGRLVKRKGFDTMIKAMSNVVEFTPRVRYIIAGAGPDEAYLKDLVKELEPAVREKISFAGAPDEAEKWRLINTCDVLVMPAREIDGDFEGFGIVFLEAALAGKAVIGARSGGAEEAIEDGETGILVEPDAPEELADRVIDLIRDFRFKEGLGFVGRERAIREFNWEGQAIKIYKFIYS